MFDMTLTGLRRALPSHPRPGLLQRLVYLNRIYRERQRLSDLPDERLKDLGLSRQNVDREARRKPWDAPEHWLRPHN